MIANSKIHILGQRGAIYIPASNLPVPSRSKYLAKEARVSRPLCAHAVRAGVWVSLFLGLVTFARAITFADIFSATTTPAPVIYVQGGTVDQQFWCFTPDPATAGPAPHPAMVLIHGGAWVAGNGEGFFPLARYFASRGMVAFTINYRLIKADKSKMSDGLSDCQSALRYIRIHAEELGVDPKRIAVLGDSAGGHLAGALATRTALDLPSAHPEIDPTPNAAILCNAITDLNQGDWIKFVIGGKALEKNAPPETKVPTPEQLSLAAHLSPLNNIVPGLPPILVMHGLDDKIVTPDQSKVFTQAMIKAGNRCDLILLPHARHAFICPKYTASEGLVVEALSDVDRFLVSLGYLQGAPTLKVSPSPAWQGKY